MGAERQPSMTISKPDLSKEAQLLSIHIQSLFNRWGIATPPRSGLHASALLVDDADWCVRKHTLSTLYPDASQSVELQSWHWQEQARFLSGWHLHEKYQKLFQQFASVVEVEKTHYDETRNLYFTPDAVIEWAGEKYVVEIKGYKQEHFDKLDMAGKPPEYAHRQANLYMHLLEIPRAIILVENKNTQEIKVWVVGYDLALSKQQVDRIYDVKRAVVLTRRDLEKLPGRICQSRDDARARACPLRDTCFLRLKPLEE